LKKIFLFGQSKAGKSALFNHLLGIKMGTGEGNGRLSET
jgi:GTPase SAR1 family protein